MTQGKKADEALIFEDKLIGVDSMTTRTCIFLIFCLSVVWANGQTSRKEYIQRYQLLAIEEMNRSGIPASIIMAQGILESGNGNSELSRKSNNHFGIKCKRGWRGKKVYYDDDEKNECFRKYKTVEDSYIDHTNFLMENQRYWPLFKYTSEDYKNWARGLKKAGYATARDYDRKLIKIIEDEQLYRLDYKVSFKEMTAFEQNKITPEITGSLTINPFQSHTIENRNGVNSVVARKGDTYEIIAQEIGLKEWELYKFNDHRPGYQPRPNEVVYIESKKRKASGNNTVHKVEPGETMHYIAQLYAIKLKPLYRRNKIKFGLQPAPGQLIHLQKKNK